MRGNIKGVLSGVYAPMNIAGLTGVDPRKPLKPLPESKKKELRKALMESGYMKCKYAKENKGVKG